MIVDENLQSAHDHPPIADSEMAPVEGGNPSTGSHQAHEDMIKLKEYQAMANIKRTELRAQEDISRRLDMAYRYLHQRVGEARNKEEAAVGRDLEVARNIYDRAEQQARNNREQMESVRRVEAAVQRDYQIACDRSLYHERKVFFPWRTNCRLGG